MEIASLINNALLVGGLIVAIVQLILLGRQVKIMTSQMKSQLNWNKKKETFDYVVRFRSELQSTNSLLQDRFRLLLLNGKPLSGKQIDEIKYNNDTRSHVFYLVTYCDQLALGIRNDYFDEEIAFESLGVAVISIYKTLIPYVEMRRQETGENVANYFVSLAETWQKRLERGKKGST
ncbi:MAG: hypothetical protein C4523_14550 [Myxococcales bacterium]|nr:MAG: hypothetical protein C4523_14550 [Myxococcales bacterium]